MPRKQVKASVPALGALIHVRWHDAHNYPVEWTCLEDIKTTVCEVVSVGWEIFHDDNQLILAGDVTRDDDGDISVNSTFAIPVGCIIDITPLRSANG